MNRPSGDRPGELAALLAVLGEPALTRMIRAHQPGDDGYCRGCTLPESGPRRWPCVLHGLAAQALDITTGGER